MSATIEESGRKIEIGKLNSKECPFAYRGKNKMPDHVFRKLSLRAVARMEIYLPRFFCVIGDAGDRVRRLATA